MGGCILPNASYSMPQISTNPQPQVVSHMTKQELVAPHIAEQPLPSVKQSPSKLSQIPLQHTLNPPKCFQSSQQAVSEMQKETQNLEQQQTTQIPMPEVVINVYLVTILVDIQVHSVARSFVE